MTTESSKPKRRWLRVRLAVVVLLCLPMLICLEAYRRQRRAQWLVSEIEAVGALAVPESFLQKLWNGRWRETDLGLSVNLAEVDGKWLREHDYLSGLPIRHLELSGSSLNAADVVRLIEEHSIETLTVQDLDDADAVARALRSCSKLYGVKFHSADLTDNGFRALPLERLNRLGFKQTEVTPAGISELERCEQLDLLWVDDRHTSAVIATLLSTRRPLRLLSLSGSQIMDDDIERLHELEVQCLTLWDTSLSDEAIAELRRTAELRRRRPRCSVTVLRSKSR